MGVYIGLDACIAKQYEGALEKFNKRLAFFETLKQTMYGPDRG